MNETKKEKKKKKKKTKKMKKKQKKVCLGPFKVLKVGSERQLRLASKRFAALRASTEARGCAGPPAPYPSPRSARGSKLVFSEPFLTRPLRRACFEPGTAEAIPVEATITSQEWPRPPRRARFEPRTAGAPTAF